MTGSKVSAIGTLVRLRLCPYGAPGIVTGGARGRVLVDCKDLGITRKHAPVSVMPAEAGQRAGKSV